jgi:nitrate reductase gamma subunit
LTRVSVRTSLRKAKSGTEYPDMRDQFLFAIAPWLAALCCLLTASVQYLGSRQTSESAETDTHWQGPADGLTKWWRYSIAVVFLGHVLAVAFPGSLLLWNRQLLRLIVLESVGLIAGSVALVCVVALAVRRQWWRECRDPLGPADAIAATLILLDIISGLALAVRYRWASSWSGVTLTPYLHSLVGFKPSVVLIAHMPFVVKLHVFSAFAVLAVMPLTGLARTLVVALRQLAYVAVAPLALVWRPIWYARRVGAARVRPPIGGGEM